MRSRYGGRCSPVAYEHVEAVATVTLLSSALPGFLDPQELVATAGLVGLIFIVFAETGLLIGFFLPGDSLLFTAGFAAAGGIKGVEISLPAALIGITVAAIVGAQTGYVIGRRAGPMLFDRPESRFFKREHVAKAEYYFQKFGPGKAVVLARFIPIVRTFLRPVAGVLGMPAATFALWNVVGGIIWGVGVTLVGYWLGETIPGVDQYLLPGIAVIILVSLLPVAIEVLRARRRVSRH